MYNQTSSKQNLFKTIIIITNQMNNQIILPDGRNSNNHVFPVHLSQIVITYNKKLFC